MSNLELVCAGFSATLGIKVVPVKDGGGFSIDDLFSQTYVMKPSMLSDGKGSFCPTCGMKYSVPFPSTASPHLSLFEEEFDVFVSDGSSVFSFRVKRKHSIHNLKTQIAGKYGITVDSVKLLHKGKELQDSQTIIHYEIEPDDKIHLLKRNSTDDSFSYGFNINDLDPKFDFDLTNSTDDGERYKRGGFQYDRPYGWKRIAIKVRGKYSDDVWLGRDGIRKEQSPGEWPVSFHGTEWEHAKKIVKEGYKVGPRERFGRGIYSSPSIKMVEKMYAKEFTHNGEKYKIALQNRVNPDRSNGHLKIIPASATGAGADYWLSPNHSDVRPYGILIRHLKADGGEPFQGSCRLM